MDLTRLAALVVALVAPVTLLGVPARAATGVVSGGGSSTLEGRQVEITYVVDGAQIKARRVIRVIFPDVG